MPVKTHKEEAYEENFNYDFEKLIKEIVVKLSKEFSPRLRFEYYGGRTSINLEVIRNGIVVDDIQIAGLITNEKKNKYKITIHSRVKKDDTIISVGKRETYTKDELEKAKNSVLIKVLDYIKKLG